MGSEVECVDALGVPVLTDRFDIANARLRFASGCVANITASRISRDRTRKIRFFQRDAYISIDTGAKAAEVYRLVRTSGGGPAIEGGRIAVADGEPLRNELQDAVDAVRSGRAPRQRRGAGARWPWPHDTERMAARDPLTPGTAVRDLPPISPSAADWPRAALQPGLSGVARRTRPFGGGDAAICLALLPIFRPRYSAAGAGATGSPPSVLRMRRHCSSSWRSRRDSRAGATPVRGPEVDCQPRSSTSSANTISPGRWCSGRPASRRGRPRLRLPFQCSRRDAWANAALVLLVGTARFLDARWQRRLVLASSGLLGALGFVLLAAGVLGIALRVMAR